MRKYLILGLALVLGGAALLIPAGAQSATSIGANQSFSGRVNGSTSPTIGVNACSGNTTTAKNDVKVKVVNSGSGNTGNSASSISFSFDSSNVASYGSTTTFTSYDTEIVIPASSFVVKCSGGSPKSSATVTFTSNGSGGGKTNHSFTVNFSLTAS